MKKLMMVLSGIAVLAFFANCGRNDQPTAPAGMAATCYYQQTSSGAGTYNYAYNQPGGLCNFNYSALSAAGFSQAQVGYGGFNQTAGYFGSVCAGSQAVVYSPSKGLGCVDSTRLNLSGQVVTYTLNQTTQTFVPSSAPSPYYQYNNGYNQMGYNQMGYNNIYGGNAFTNNGMLTVLRVCDGVELCPSGQSCRSPTGPISYASGIGVCYF